MTSLQEEKRIFEEWNDTHAKNVLLCEEIDTLRAVDKELRETIARQEIDLEKQRKQLQILVKQSQTRCNNGTDASAYEKRTDANDSAVQNLV